MATRKQTESALRKLVQKGSSLRAVAITGQWGCGKTHLVNAYFETSAAGAPLKASNLKYVYVSLFGLGTLQEVRRRISTVVIGTHAQRLLGVSKMLSQLAAPVTAVAGLEINLGGLGETTAALIEEKVTRQLVVCFDDLERASVAVSESDLFGLISELTEQRECKCILIFNREKMDAAAKSKAATQEEKIFDLVLDYSPTTSENLVHGFADRSTREIAEPVFKAFENSNIRIMRRLAWVLSQLDETEVAHLDKVRTRLIRNAATLCLIKYACADTVPDVSVLCEPSTSVSAMLGYANFAKEIPDHLRALLKGLDHAPADFDECIVGLLQDGALDEPKFERAVAKVYEEQRHSREREELHAIWESLRQGFAQSGEAFSKRLTGFLNRQHESIHPSEIVSLCDLLLAVDSSQKSEALVRQFFTPFIRVYPVGQRTELMKQFPEIERLKIHETEPHVPRVGRRDLEEIFQSIAGRLDSWNPSDARELDGFSDDEIEAFILAHRSAIAIAQFKNLLSRAGGDQSSDTAEAKARRSRLAAIMERIAARDPLFRYQIKTLMPQFN